MPRFSINVTMMLQEHAFLDRFQAAADLGFAAVDIQYPYDFPAPDVAARVRAAGVEPVLINLPGGDVAGGEVGFACQPARRDEFRRGIESARRYALEMGAKRVNVLAGRTGDGDSTGVARQALVANLAEAAEVFARDNILVMVEPINGRDVPGFFLQTIDAALAAIEQAGHPNLALQFDLYHRQVMRGELIEGVRAALPRIGHIQFADNPGRHEPGTGEINFPVVFAALDAMGYDGWVGAEYRPTGRTADSLAWFRR